MATARDIITDAMKEIRALSSGETPTSNEADDGLTALQRIMDGLFGFGLGVALSDLDVDADSDIDPNIRAIVTAPVTLTFPDSPLNGDRIQIKNIGGVSITIAPGNRSVEGSNPTTDDASFVYVAETATWALVSPLTLDTAMPFGDDEFFVLETAKRLAPMFGASLSQESGLALMRATNRFKARFSPTVAIPADDGVRFLSTQSYRNGFPDR
jgi:hypothetical protein